MMNYRYIWPLLIILTILVFGCSSTKVKVSWKNPNYSEPVKKVYVIGLAKLERTRRIFEDEFCKNLATYGITCIPSYIDLSLSEEINKETITAKVKANGADSVLLTRAVGKRTEEVVNPGPYSSFDYAQRASRRSVPDPYYNNYGSYVAQNRGRLYELTNTIQFEVINVEASLYIADSAKLVWLTQLDTVVDDNLEKLLAKLIEKMTKKLNSDGLI